MRRNARIRHLRRVTVLAGALAIGLASGLLAIETLELNRALQSGATTTGSTSFSAVASVTNAASVAGDVAVLASFSANPAGGGSGGRAGEWRLVAGGQQSTVIRRDMSDSLNDYGIMNLAWTFENLAPGATVTLQHRSTNGLRVGTEDLTLVTIPMTTEPAGVVLDHDLDSLAGSTFSSGAPDFVPVEKGDGSDLVATVEVAPMTVPRDVFLAATFSASKPQVGPADAFWKLQLNEISSPPAMPCRDGLDVGTTIQRSLSGSSDVGAVMLYAITEDLDPGTYEFRLCTASPSGATIDSFSASLIGFALHFVGNGVGGHFPRIQDTVGQAQVSGGNLEAIAGLVDSFTIGVASDVLLAMSSTAFSQAGGEGDFGRLETCIDQFGGGFFFGGDQNGTSQEVRRRFASSNDRGAGGQVGLALSLPAGTYNARGCASVTGNPINLVDPNLVGFVPRSVDDTTVPVTLAWFRATGADGEAIEWATATEVGNLGFHLYGVSKGQVRRLNRELIPSRATEATLPTFYRFRAPAFADEAVLLEDVDINGRSRFHGPYELGAIHGSRPDPPRLTDWDHILRKRQLSRSGAARDRQLVSGSFNRAERRPTVNLGVDRDGVYRVTHEQLMAAGIDLGGVKTDRLALLNRGRPVPIRIGGAERFGPGSFVEFVGRGLETLYTRINVYSLRVAPRLRSHVRRDSTVPPVGQPATSYREDRRVESNRLYDFASPGEDPWYDTRLLAVSEPVEASYPLELDGLSAGVGPVELTIELWGVTDFPADPDHHVVVEVNGVLLADEWFDGLRQHPIELRIPQRLLDPTANSIRLRLPHDTGAPYDLVNYDYYRVSYPRHFQAADGRLCFTAAAPLLRVDGLPSSEVVVYRMTMDEVELLEGLQISGLPGDYSVTFPGSDQPATYFVSTVEALQAPTIEKAPRPVRLNGGEAELLILSHPEFLAGIEPLVQARRAEGYSVRVADVTQVYQRYAHGVFEPAAIRTFLRFARRRLGTRYVLLVGGDTYDYHGYLESGAVSFVPTLYARTDRIVRYAPVDPLYGDVNGDGAPELAIGRLPVRNVDELEALIDKTLEYPARAGSKTAVAAADSFDLMSNTSFAELSESLLSNLTGWEIERAYLDDADLETTRRILLERLDEGVSLASYVGHSGPSVWSFQGLLKAQDAAALENRGRPTVVTQWGCWNTYFVSPTHDSLAHALLLSGDQGAVAVLGATTLTQVASEQALGSRFFAALDTPGVTVGAALRDAKLELASTQPDLADVLLGWTLLGDPTLVLDP